MIFLTFQFTAKSQLYEYYITKANSFIDMDNYEQAIFYYNKAVEHSPNLPQGYFHRALPEYFSEDYENALDDLNHVLSIDPNYIQTYKYRGMVYEALFNNEQALNDYNIYLDSFPNHLVTLSSKAWILCKLNRENEAKEVLDRALSIDSNHIPTLNVLGLYYEQIKLFHEAVEQFTLIIQLDPGYGSSYYNRGRNNYYLENYAQACSDWKIATQLGIEDAAWLYDGESKCK